MAAPNSEDWPKPVVVLYRYDEKYKLCCCHVRNWAIGWGIFELIVVILDLGGAAIFGKPATSDFASPAIMTSLFYIRIAMDVLWLIAVCLMLHGVRKEISRMLIPHIALQVFSIFVWIGFMIWYSYTASKVATDYTGPPDSEHTTERVVATVWITSAIVYMVVALLEAFLLYVYIKCYRFLKDMESIPQVSPVPTTTITTVSMPMYYIHPGSAFPGQIPNVHNRSVQNEWATPTHGSSIPLDRNFPPSHGKNTFV